MKKLVKRLLAVLMALAMMAPVLSTVAFAATPQNVKQYKSYVSLGDSIAAGFSMPDYLNKRHGKYVIDPQRIEGSYPALIADTLKVKNFYPYACPGYRSNELRFLLDNNYEGDYITQKWVATLSHLDSNTLEGMNARRPAYQNAVKTSDVMTLDIGLNDTWLPVMGAIQEIMYQGDPAKSVEQMEKDGAEASNDLDSVMKDLSVIMTSPIYAPKLIDATYKILTMSDYLENYEAIVNRIYELNPNITICALSTYNPFRDWPEAWAAPLKQAAQKALYDKMNNQKKEFAQKYGDKFLYIDINDLPPVRHDSFEKVLATGSMGMWDPHPTEAGHKYIADKVIEALPTK